MYPHLYCRMSVPRDRTSVKVFETCAKARVSNMPCIKASPAPNSSPCKHRDEVNAKSPNARCCCAELCRDTTGFGKIEVFIMLLVMLKDLPSDHEAVRRKTRCGAAAALAEVF